MVSRFLVGRTGLTAYERRRGRKCRIPLVAFGEMVWYKEIRRGKERAIQVGERVARGALAGTAAGRMRPSSGRVKGWSEPTLSSARMRRAAGTPSISSEMKVTLQQLDPPHEESQAPAEGPVDECDRQVRRMRITGVMLQKYGYTEGLRRMSIQTRRNARGTFTYRGMPQEDRGGDDGRRDGPPQGGRG